jgi:tetratricopeptide (TPR) repeat protein
MGFRMDDMVTNWRAWLPQSILILAVGWWIYSPTFFGGWIWDDDVYVSHNHVIQDPAGFWKVWTHPDGQGDYYPLTSFVEWIQWHLEGNDMLGYHLTSIGLHLVSAFLLWHLFARLGLARAWLGALIFTVHPVMVESVAWISELKNTLALPPLLLAMIAWLHGRDGRGRRFEAWALVCFLVSLLAKTSGVMLPVIFLAHAWWKEGRISREVLRATAPFFALALLAGVVTLVPHHVPGAPHHLQPNWRLSGALASVGWSIPFLLGKCILPYPLLPVYPALSVDSPSLDDLPPWVALAVLAYLLGRTRGTRHLFFGFGFFMINLAPVLLYIFMKYTIMVWSMDHLVYLPVIGLIGLAVAGVGYFEAHLALPWRVAERGLVAGVVILVAWGSHAYADWYQSAEVLWTRTLQRDPGAWVADENLSSALVDQRRYAEALAYDRRLLALKPAMSDAHYNLGLGLEKTGHPAEAADEYREAARLDPTNGKVYINLGTLLLTMKKVDEATTQYEQAIRFNPDYAELRYDLGSLRLHAGNLSGAIEQLEVAVKLDPDLAQAHENLGSALARSGRLPEAREQFTAAVELDPGYEIARYDLAMALAQTGHLREAIDQFQHVLQLDPDNALARGNLAKLEQFEKTHPAPPGP